MRSGFRTRGVGLAAVLVAALAAPVAVAAQAGPEPLVGTFRIAAGSCEGAEAAGSTFRMVLPNGDGDGPFVSNNDSACGDQTYTLLAPGTDGGLITGAHQPAPSPAFDDAGNGLADRITEPVAFYGVAFAPSTNPTDPQTATAVPAPSVAAGADGALTGDLRSFAATWNRQEFNQGAPKPDGSLPGITAAPTGAYDASTGSFTLDWSSQIEGGPFDRFTGVWHLEGTFVPATAPAGAPDGAGAGSPAGPPPSTPAGSGASAGTGGASPTTSAAAAGSTAAGDTAPSTVAGPADLTPGDSPAPAGGSTAVATSDAGDDRDDALPPWLVVLAAVLIVAAVAGSVALQRGQGRSGAPA